MCNKIYNNFFSNQLKIELMFDKKINVKMRIKVIT